MRKCVIPEKLEKFELKMIDHYYLHGDEINYDFFGLVSSMMLCLDSSSDKSVYFELTNIFSKYASKKEQQVSLLSAIKIIKEYAKNGEKIDEIMSTNLVSSKMSEIQRRIKIKTKKMEQFIENCKRD